MIIVSKIKALALFSPSPGPFSTFPITHFHKQPLPPTHGHGYPCFCGNVGTMWISTGFANTEPND